MESGAKGCEVIWTFLLGILPSNCQSINDLNFFPRMHISDRRTGTSRLLNYS